MVTLSEAIRFPEILPITAAVREIAEAIAAHQVIIVAGETGSGKTTQLPKICLAMGRGLDAQIGCTQPRRIAASSVAARVAQELDSEIGGLVGFKVRFSDRVSRASRIKFMTDGMLLAEIQGDAMLRAYDTIIVDEAHERSLNIDFLLGFLKRLLPRRPELRIIVSSATLELERFSKFFGGAPVIGVSGRTYPVDVIYRPPTDDEGDLSEAVANTVNEIAELDPRGDILVFLPGEREIRETASELEQRAIPRTVILPLFARLSAAEQQRVFQTLPQRRVVLATNVAETSLTIPGIVYVVDAGLARVNRYSVRTGVTQLLVEPISRASADQRKGRCGRVESGVCFRLYEEADYTARPAHTDPEIKRVGLAGVILRMMALRLGDIATFPFLDPPQKRAIDEGYRVLEELGAITSLEPGSSSNTVKGLEPGSSSNTVKGLEPGSSSNTVKGLEPGSSSNTVKGEGGRLTKIGDELGRLPLDPRLGRMILGARDENCLREVVAIAAALGLQDPRDRPLAAQAKADEAHKKWRDEGSDFVGYLKLWTFWRTESEKGTRRQIYKLCKENFLSYNRMREWEDIHSQIVRVMREWELSPNTQPASGDQIHRALLPGLLSRIGLWNQETRNYLGARQTRFVIHPSSGLAKKPPQWMMAAELVETSQLFARQVAKIDPAWIESAGGDLCKRSHGDPHWEQKAGQVMAKEQVTLYGLPVVKNRTVAYAQYDPVLSRELFITHALVRHEYTTKGPFMEHNRRLLDDVQHLRDKARKSDMVADEASLYDFFDRVIPPGVVSGKTFEQWRREAEAKDPRALFLDREDILLDEAGDLSPARFPDKLGPALPLAYRFDPGEDDDGITVTVPLAMLPQLDAGVMAWTIPGWHAIKIRALLDSLPKAMRRAVAASATLDEVAGEVARAVKPFDGAMLPALERAVYAATGERVPRDAWDLREVPAYLSFGYRVVDEHDKVLASGRDLTELQRVLGRRASEAWSAAPRSSYEKTGLRGWDFDALPATVTLTVAGKKVLAYPALVEAETTVDLKLMESAAAAAIAMRAGLRKLYVINSGTTVAKLEAQMPVMAIAPKRTVVLRALDEAFRVAEIPAGKTEFAARLAEGRAKLGDIVGGLVRTALDLSGELDKVRAALKPLAGRPGATRTAIDDIQAQLQHVAPLDLFATAAPARLANIARYLRGIGIRLQRIAHDPQKDAQKALTVAPFWTAYHTHKLASPELDDFGWLVEEFRIATFAPELKAAVPVSVARMQDAWSRVPR